LFLLPPQTPLWTWAAGSLLSIVLLNVMLAARAKGKFGKVGSGTDTGVNWFRLSILSITAAVVGGDFYYHRNKLDALSFFSALLAIVVLGWVIFTKSRKSERKP
jgi:hypothetical protein